MINKLNNALLQASKNSGDLLIKAIIRAIKDTMMCQMCTLWGINHNNTVRDFRSASLIIRDLADGFYYPYHNDEDYVHELNNCFIEDVLTTIHNKRHIYCIYTLNECVKHLSYKALKEMDLNYFICIPIYRERQVVALLKLSYTKNKSFKDIEQLSVIISQVVSSCLSRHLLYEKQQILEDLICNYRDIENKKFQKIFEPVINRIFRRYFKYEGASVFLWDSYSNRFNLLVTTGLQEDINKNDIFYFEGEGLTGRVAIEKKAIIYDNLPDLERENNSLYLHKYKEITEHSGKTMLSVPIFRPSNPSKVFGIIRFTNKINSQSEQDNIRVVDYFNDVDVDLINNALHYLALNIDNYLAEEERNNFIAKFSHESKTPANAIRITAERIKRKLGDDRFMRLQFSHYLQSIIDYAELQMMQATTNLYVSKFNGKLPKSEIYTVRKYSIREVIEDSINIVRPFARDYGVQFDSIKVCDNFPESVLYIDKSAFITVFYNILNNAIKYTQRDTEFSVEFNAYETLENLIINIADYGIGVDEKDKEKIFLLGVRSDKAKKTNSEGYGIGLHVVQQILFDFGGTIQVKNCFYPTIFEIKLPNKLYNDKYLKSDKWNK
jgi:sensory box histidine kinase